MARCQLSTSSDGKRHLPLPTGPYSVGSTDLMTSDNNGILIRCFYPFTDDPKDANENSSRWIKWYPSREYVDGYIQFKMGRKVPMAAWLVQWLTHDPYCPVVEGATLCQKETFPVIVFSHGLGGCRTTYSTLLTDVASHGYFVAAVEHKDGSAAVTFTVGDDGTKEWIRYRRVSPDDEEYAYRNGQVNRRAEECKQVLQLLEDLTDESQDVDDGSRFVHHVPSQPFLASLKSRLNTKEAVISGHSFGGATVVTTVLNKVATEKSEFVCGICFDSWLFPIHNEAEGLMDAWKEDNQGLDPNLFFVNCEMFQSSINLETMSVFESPVAGSDVPSNVLTLRKAYHYAPSDMLIVIFGSRARIPLGFLLGLGHKKTTEEEGELNLPPDGGLTACCDFFSGYLAHLSGHENKKLSECLTTYEQLVIHGSGYKKKQSEDEK